MLAARPSGAHGFLFFSVPVALSYTLGQQRVKGSGDAYRIASCPSSSSGVNTFKRHL